jgi:diguanylate cyclase (GGDEF)-like protein
MRETGTEQQRQGVVEAAAPERTAAPPPPRDDDYSPRRWFAAGALGVTAAVGVVMGGAFGEIHPTLAVFTAVIIGFFSMAAFAPHRQIRLLRQLREERAAMALLADKLRRMNLSSRDEPLSQLVLDRDDELGDLSRAIRDRLAEAIVARIEARQLHRTMESAVRRETDRLTAQLRREAMTDPLTGLGNRRSLQHQVDRMLRCEIGLPRTIAAMAIDIDLFKVVNDELGHDVGDRCLVFLGELLRSNLGPDDCAMRIGGDEVAILLPGMSLVEAETFAQRLASLFAQMPWPHTQLAHPSLSIGLACDRPATPDELDELIHRADEALYRSKRAGRARITSWRDYRGAA